MAYADMDKLRYFTLGSKTNTSINTELTDLATQADAKIDVLLYEQAKRQKKITYLPVLPLQGTDITDPIKSAASEYAAYLYFLGRGQIEKSKEFERLAFNDVRDYINKMKVDGKIGVAIF